MKNKYVYTIENKNLKMKAEPKYTLTFTNSILIYIYV